VAAAAAGAIDTVPLVLWAKVLVPVVLATTGVGAGVAGAVLDDDGPATTGPARAWVDSPIEGATVGPGTVPVDGHAADPTSAIAALELLVDGDVVATDDDLDRARDLVYAMFDWTAEVGVHELIVREVGGGATSAGRTVVIVEGMAPAPARPDDEDGDSDLAAGATTTTAPSTTSSSSTTPPDEETTTTAGPEGTTTTSAPPAVTTPPGGTDPGPGPTEPPPAPEILRADVVGAPGDGRIYAVPCVYAIQVRAVISGAEAATVTVDGTSFAQQMDRNGDEYTLTISSGTTWSGAVGTHGITIVAGQGESTTQASAGSVTIGASCPKD
jgi:hypothetical protein